MSIKTILLSGASPESSSAARAAQLYVALSTEENPRYKSVNNCLIDKTTKTLVLGSNESVIPEDGSVVYIGYKAFYSTSFNNSDKWVDGALYIGKYLINVNEELVSGTFNIKEGTVCIANGAFKYCNLISGISMPSSVKVIGENAFYYCTGIKSITLADSVTDVGRGAFYGCEKLKTVNSLGNITAISDNMFYGCELLTGIVIHDGVTSIGKNAFMGCKALKSIVVPDSVTSIGEKAFADCIALTSVKYEGTEEQWNSIEKGASWDEAYPYESNKIGFTVTYNFRDE